MSTTAPAPAPSARFRRVLEILGLLAGASTILAALLFYFGWARTQALYGYFGISSRILGYSINDYELGSPNALFLPIVGGLLLATAALFVYAGLSRFLQGATTRRIWAVILSIAGVAVGLLICGVIGVSGHLTLFSSQLFNPIALGLGAFLIEYSLTLLDTWTLTTRGTPAMTRGLTGLRRGLVSGIVLVAAFWGITQYAVQEGSGLAKHIQKDPQSLPVAVIYSKHHLHIIESFGVKKLELHGEYILYHYRYAGLRLLTYTKDRWVLLPEGWTRDNGATVVVLRDDPEVRVDFQPP